MSFEVRLAYAFLTRDTEILTNMDPYCILTLGKERYRSRTARGAGKKPVWFHTFKFDTLETILKVTMMDEDTIVDDLIGQGVIDLSGHRFRFGEHTGKEFVQLRYKEEGAGKVKLMIKSLLASEPQFQRNPFNENSFYGIPQTLAPPAAYWNQLYQQPCFRMKNNGISVLRNMNCHLTPNFQNGYKHPHNKQNTDQLDQLLRDNDYRKINPTSKKDKAKGQRLVNRATRRDDRNPFIILEEALNSKNGNYMPFENNQQMFNMGVCKPNQHFSRAVFYR